MQQHTLRTLPDFITWAKDFSHSLKFHDRESTLVLLSGDLGVGKTTFVQTVAEYFGVTEPITSPTFVIQKEYSFPEHQGFTRMVHIDAYRLTGKNDLEYLGWENMLKDSTTLIFLEWPEIVSGIHLPTQTISLHISIGEQQERIITQEKLS